MIPEFSDLSREEIDLLLKTPALVTVLIAGADNNIDSMEIQAAKTTVHLKKVNAREILKAYYNEVDRNFEQQLEEFIEQYPLNSEERQLIIISELEKLNVILRKLDKTFAMQFYASIKGFAKKVGEASGGFLGYLPTGYEEHKLVGLSMINEPK